MIDTTMKGFILSSADDDLCETIGLLNETSPSTYNLTTTAFDYFPYNASSVMMTVSTTNFARSLIPQTKLYQMRNQCCNLNTASFPSAQTYSINYFLDFPQQSQSIQSPSISQCTDSFPMWYFISWTPMSSNDPISSGAIHYTA